MSVNTKRFQERLKEANEAVKARQQSLNKRYRLGYHIMAPANWINDPNGLVYYKGEYHVFYQHHPFNEHWGPMYWGHVKSKDLVHWEHLPIALAPGDGYDLDGCFSGSAVDDNGTLTLIYTGHNWIDQQKDLYKQNQSIAISHDGMNFEKVAENPVIQEAPADSSKHFRDPKVWKHEDTWYMVVGNSTKENKGRVLLYESKNLREWTYKGVLAEADEKLGFMWECPDFFELDGKHVLMFSPQGIEAEGDNYQNLFQTGYMVGTYDYETNEFQHGEFHELDKGHDFYAVQTFLDGKGRRIAIGWMDMWESEMPTKEDGWAGALTLPRELFLNKEGKVIMKPVEELKLLRKEKLSASFDRIQNESIRTDVKGDLLELNVTFRLKDAKQFGLKVRTNEPGTEETVIGYNVNEEKLFLNRDKSGKGVRGIRKQKLALKNKKLSLRLFVDRSSVEVFANDGEEVMTSRIYPNEESLGVELFALEGEVEIVEFEAWKLKDIWETE